MFRNICLIFHSSHRVRLISRIVEPLKVDIVNQFIVVRYQLVIKFCCYLNHSLIMYVYGDKRVYNSLLIIENILYFDLNNIIYLFTNRQILFQTFLIHFKDFSLRSTQLWRNPKALLIYNFRCRNDFPLMIFQKIFCEDKMSHQWACDARRYKGSILLL